MRKALAEPGYLKAVPAGAEKGMVFTDDGFCHLIQRRATRLGTEPIQMMACPLPPLLGVLLKEILDKASYEQRMAE